MSQPADEESAQPERPQRLQQSTHTPSAVSSAAPLLAYRSPPDAQELATRPKPKFRIAWAALLLVILYVVVEWNWVLPVARHEQVPKEDMAPYMMGRTLAGPGFALLIAWG